MEKFEVHCNGCGLLAIYNEKKNICIECNSIDVVVLNYEMNQSEEIFEMLRGELNSEG